MANAHLLVPELLEQARRVESHEAISRIGGSGQRQKASLHIARGRRRIVRGESAVERACHVRRSKLDGSPICTLHDKLEERHRKGAVAIVGARARHEAYLAGQMLHLVHVRSCPCEHLSRPRAGLGVHTGVELLDRAHDERRRDLIARWRLANQDGAAFPDVALDGFVGPVESRCRNRVCEGTRAKARYCRGEGARVTVEQSTHRRDPLALVVLSCRSCVARPKTLALFPECRRLATKAPASRIELAG